MTASWKLRCPSACEDWGTEQMVLSVRQMSHSLCQLCKKQREFFGYSLFSLISTSKECNKCNTPSDVMRRSLVVIIPSDRNSMENLQAGLHFCHELYLNCTAIAFKFIWAPIIFWYTKYSAVIRCRRMGRKWWKMESKRHHAASMCLQARRNERHLLLQDHFWEFQTQT
jgi:hypothetical protein